MKAYQIIAQGNVQGVGFRYYVLQIAQQLGLKGTVRNLSNGDVQIIVQCSQKELEDFTKTVQIPQHAMMKVTKLTVNVIDVVKEYTKFSIVY